VVLDEHSDDPIEGDCLICGDEMTAEDASISRCGHAFCNICWQGTMTCPTSLPALGALSRLSPLT
jgi:hypothetical protein